MSEMVDQSSDWSRNLINPLQGGAVETSALASTSQRQHLNKGFLNLKLMEEEKTQEEMNFAMLLTDDSEEKALELLNKTVNINGVEMRCTVLAKTVWFGVMRMAELSNIKGITDERKSYLCSCIKEGLYCSHIIMGFSKEKAEIEAERWAKAYISDKKKTAGKAE